MVVAVGTTEVVAETIGNPWQQVWQVNVCYLVRFQRRVHRHGDATGRGHGEQRRHGLRALVQVHRDALARGEAVLVQPAPGAQDVVRQLGVGPVPAPRFQGVGVASGVCCADASGMS